MSSYNTRWCEKHGEWEQDVDNSYEECGACVEEGVAPSQLAAKELARLRSEITRLRGVIASSAMQGCDHLYETWINGGTGLTALACSKCGTWESKP